MRKKHSQKSLCLEVGIIEGEELRQQLVQDLLGRIGCEIMAGFVGGLHNCGEVLAPKVTLDAQTAGIWVKVSAFVGIAICRFDEDVVEKAPRKSELGQLSGFLKRKTQFFLGKKDKRNLLFGGLLQNIGKNSETGTFQAKVDAISSSGGQKVKLFHKITKTPWTRDNFDN